MLKTWRSYKNIPLNTSALRNQLLICSRLKKFKKTNFSISRTACLLRKILMLTQKYLRTIVEFLRLNLMYLGNSIVLLSQDKSQFIKKV